ncbi:MAG: hypothetical protein EP348_06195 [Alphaproteobacteria bacterium]|nr:MAG: hypothetical protein EP348_06195 [Alphaproteobacteria bacterium]
MNRLAIATIAFFAMISAAAAQMPHMQHPAEDKVVLTLTTEGWVKTDTARVSAIVDLVQQQGQDAEAIKKRIAASLKSLADGVEWRYISSSQRQDQTGLNRWYIMAEARVPEAKLSGLEDRAKEASSPGYKLSIQQVDFTPSLAEFEKLRADLRSDIYKQAIAEAKRLNEVMDGPDYRVRRVDFVMSRASFGNADDSRPRAMLMKSAEAAPANSAGGNSTDLLVSVKQSVTAEVILGRTEAGPKAE